MNALILICIEIKYMRGRGYFRARSFKYVICTWPCFMPRKCYDSGFCCTHILAHVPMLIKYKDTVKDPKEAH